MFEEISEDNMPESIINKLKTKLENSDEFNSILVNKLFEKKKILKQEYTEQYYLIDMLQKMQEVNNPNFIIKTTKAKETIECTCGKKVSKYNMKKHLITNIHLNNL